MCSPPSGGFDRSGLGHGACPRAWVSVGSVPGRWSSFVFVSSLAEGFVCGSVQSLCAMALPWSGRLLPLSSSSDLFGGGARRPAATSVVTEVLEDFFVISLVGTVVLSVSFAYDPCTSICTFSLNLNIYSSLYKKRTGSCVYLVSTLESRISSPTAIRNKFIFPEERKGRRRPAR